MTTAPTPDEREMLVKIGQRIKARRTHLGLSGDHVAGVAGISPSTLERVEAGAVAATTVTIYRIGRALGVSAAWTLGGGRALTRQQIDETMAAIEGRSQVMAARVLGISPGAVVKRVQVMRRMGFDVPRYTQGAARRGMTLEEARELLRRVAETSSHAEAARCGAPVTTVTARIRSAMRILNEESSAGRTEGEGGS